MLIMRVDDNRGGAIQGLIILTQIAFALTGSSAGLPSRAERVRFPPNAPHFQY